MRNREKILKQIERLEAQIVATQFQLSNMNDDLIALYEELGECTSDFNQPGQDLEEYIRNQRKM